VCWTTLFKEIELTRKEQSLNHLAKYYSTLLKLTSENLMKNSIYSQGMLFNKKGKTHL
jgi:hypothetical protein